MRLDRTFLQPLFRHQPEKNLKKERPYTLNTKTYETAQVSILHIGIVAGVHRL